MTDQTAPTNAGDAAPAVGYRLPTGDEREQLRAEIDRLRAEIDRLYAENDRLRRELERVKAELSEARVEERRKVAAKLRAYADNYPPDVFPPDSDNRTAIGGTAMRHAYLNAARIAERDAARQLVGELQDALVRVADQLHEIERYARRTSDAEP